MNPSSSHRIVRVADADESTPKIDFAYIDKKYKEWLVRRGFAAESDSGELGMRRSKLRGVAKRTAFHDND